MARFLRRPGFSDALVILGAAGIVIPAFARFRISPVIGFILVGMLVGPVRPRRAERASIRGCNYVTISNPHAIEPFAELGIILLLFSIGLELSFRRLWSMRELVFGVGAAELIVLRGAHRRRAAISMGQSLSGAVALGLALALSSTALVLPLVGTHSPVGRSALAMLLFEDLALVPIVFAARRDGAACAASGVGSLLRTMLIGGADRRRDAGPRPAAAAARCSPRRRGPRAPSCSSPPACWW